MKKLFILLLFLVISPQAALSFRISEIMYNPSGSDSGREWIEIYNDNNTINISGFKLFENSQNHNINLVNGSYLIEQNSYAIIADDAALFLQDYPDFNSTLFDSSFSLSNSGETIAIKNGTLVIDELAYDSELANGNGKSLSIINSSWYESIPTPGQQNLLEERQQITQDLSLEVFIDDIIYANFAYTKLFKITNINPEFGRVYNITVNYNITKDFQLIKQDSFIKDELNQYLTSSTGSFMASEAGNYTICGIIISSTANDTNQLNDKSCKTITAIDTSSLACNLSINITTDKDFYLDNETIKFYNNLNDESFPYTIEYWVEDLFGNIFKEKINTTNTNQKSYSPKISEQDFVLLVKNQLHALCNDLNLSNNNAEKMLIIKNTNPQFLSIQENSSLEIIKIYDLTNNKAKFGQTIRANVNIYKGDTAKNSISLWIEDSKGSRISKESSTNIYQKYTSHLLSLPIQIKPNCDYDYDDGTYKLVIEGLGEIDSKNIEIAGITKDLCEKTTIEKTTKTSGSFTYAIADAPQEVFSGEEFTIQLSIKNDDDEEHKATVWSYVYRGSKCYCSGREENKQEIYIAPEREEIITLNNKVIDAEPGDYKLKVNIIKDSQKTIRELTEEIKVVPSAAESSVQPFSQNQPSQETSLESKKYPQLIYESTTIKARELIPAFIIMLLALLSAVLIWKR